MNKTWTRIVIVVIAAAAVAFWVYFDKQRMQRTLNSSLIPPSTRCPPGR